MAGIRTQYCTENTHCLQIGNESPIGFANGAYSIAHATPFTQFLKHKLRNFYLLRVLAIEILPYRDVQKRWVAIIIGIAATLALFFFIRAA